MKSPHYANALQRHALAGGAAPVAVPRLWVALHEEDPSGQDLQSFAEIGPPRASIMREAAAWTFEGTLWRNVAPIAFERVVTGGTAKYWTLGVGQAGDTFWLTGGKLHLPQFIVPGAILTIPAGLLTSEEI